MLRQMGQGRRGLAALGRVALLAGLLAACGPAAPPEYRARKAAAEQLPVQEQWPRMSTPTGDLASHTWVQGQAIENRYLPLFDQNGDGRLTGTDELYVKHLAAGPDGAGHPTVKISGDRPELSDGSPTVVVARKPFGLLFAVD